MLDYILKIASEYSYIGIYFLMLLESSIFIVPSELIMAVAGFLAFTGKINLFYATFFAALGNISGSTILYLLSRFGKVHVLYRFGPKVKVGIQKADALFDKYDKLAVLIAQFIPGVRAFISIPAGVFEMSYLSFIFITFVGAFIWCGSLGYGALLLGQNWQTIIHYFKIYEHVIWGILLVLLGIGTFFVLKKKAK